MKICIVVPVFNGGKFIEQVMRELLHQTSSDILVVDDGSSEKVVAPSQQSRLRVHRFNENRGKGAALQWALGECLSKGYTHILSFDGDGQHRAQDVTGMLEALGKNPQALVIGVRLFGEGVPGISQFGRKFSNFWVYYQTGLKVKDSQSGLRIYPLENLAGLRFFTRRYDFEIEILVRAIWRGIPVVEAEVGVNYPADRISHFDKLKDNTRITLLNIYLIAWSLIFYRLSWPRKILVALLSVPLSLISPWWLGLLSGILACVILRLNALVMLLCLIALMIF